MKNKKDIQKKIVELGVEENKQWDMGHYNASEHAKQRKEALLWVLE